MRLVCALLLLFLPNSAFAEEAPLLRPEQGEFLPLANGRVAIPFVQSETAVPVRTGATVEFVSQGGLKVRELLWATGFVLGTREGVVLIEADPDTAVGVALALKRIELRLQTKHLPDPEVIALRLEHQGNDHGILLAPRLVSFTAAVEASQDEVDALKPGQRLALGRDGEFVEVRYISATKVAEGVFEMTIAEREGTIVEVIRLAKAGLLRPKSSEIKRDRRCFIVHRRGGERSRVQIPCT